MSLFTLPYNPVIGPIVDIVVFYPASMLPAGADPTKRAQVTVPMIVDTGADITSLATSVAIALGLPVLGQRPVRSTTHQQPANIYLGDFMLTAPGISPATISDVRYLDFPQGQGAVQGLLGRDILAGSLIQVNGKENTLTIAF